MLIALFNSVEDSVRVQEDRFREAMRMYEDNAPDKYKTGVDLNSPHSTAQLWNIVENAVEKYHSKDKNGLWGKVVYAFRKLGDGSDAAQGWLGLLPTDSNYLSVVCGGLKLIINVSEYAHAWTKSSFR